MLPNRILALFAVLLCAGCKVHRQTAWVDVDKVLSDEQATPFALPTITPVGAATAPSMTMSLPGMPAEDVQLRSNSKRVQEVQAVLEQSRKQAQAEIEQGLRNAYLRDIAKEESRRLVAIQPQQSAAYQKALDAALGLFHQYATKRGHILVPLSLIAGFPDPDPQSQRVPGTQNVHAQKQFATAKSLRAQLVELDSAYEGQVHDLLAQAQGEYAEALKRVQQDIKTLRDEADAKAGQQAAAEVKHEQEQLQSVLAGQSVVSFPAEPQKTVTIQGSNALPPAPRVDVPGKAEIQVRLKSAIQSDVKIWAGLNNLDIARTGTDRTADFMKWRTEHLNTR